jgi:ankyrin repeat protein
VDVANEFGHTPLAEAVRQGDARMVKTLLGAGSGTEGANADGQTALMVAIKNGDLPIFQMLIDAGAKVNVAERVQDQTPLMWAAAATRNADAMAKVLIAKGADVNARARFNDWPSQITSEPRAQYHAYGGLTPLLYAARGGCYRCVEALIAGGADVNLPTPEGVSPIMIALDNGHNGVARLLMDRGGNPHVWDVYGRTALYIAVGNAGGAGAGGRGAAGAGAPGAGGRGRVGGGAAGGAAAPAGPGAQPAPAAGGRGAEATPPAAAAQAGPGRGGAGQGARGGQGVAGGAAARAASGADSGPQVSAMEMINLLLAAGVDANAQLTGAASYSGRIARALTGDPVNTTSNEGMTALHVAVRSQNASFVRYLLDRGARTDIKDASGRTPLDVLNGVPAFQPAVFADADGVVPPNPNAAPAAPARGGNPAAVQEIRALLQGTPPNQPN